MLILHSRWRGKDMNIVVSGYVGKKITGIGRNIMCLLDNVNSDNKYIIYTNEDMKDYFQFDNPNVKVKTYKVSKSDSLGNLLWTTFVFPFVVLKEKADKALIPNFTFLLFKFRPTIVIMHDLIEFNIPDKFSPLKMFYRTKIADPITAKRADHIITVSENSKKDILKFLKVSEDKISVIYNGVDQKKFCRMSVKQSNVILKENGWPSDFLLYAGTIDHPGKNAMGVIRAFEKLKNSDKYKGSLVLAGMPGSGYDIVESYVKESHWNKDIIFTDFVTDEQLIALYSRCKVFCFLSLYEGFGIPPLEAIACGANVVASNTSSLPEVVGNVGITVDPLNIDAIVDAIIKNIECSEKEHIDEREEHLKKYDWKNLSIVFEKCLTNMKKL